LLELEPEPEGEEDEPLVMMGKLLVVEKCPMSWYYF
jgi:hypothetical protein